jgi:hypothetical protein
MAPVSLWDKCGNCFISICLLPNNKHLHVVKLKRGREARLATYQGKMHGTKLSPANGMARGEFGELTRGEQTRFDCIVFLVLDKWQSDNYVYSHNKIIHNCNIACVKLKKNIYVLYLQKNIAKALHFHLGTIKLICLIKTWHFTLQ